VVERPQGVSPFSITIMSNQKTSFESTESELPRDEFKARALTRITLLTAVAIAILNGLVSIAQAERGAEFLAGSMNFAGAILYLVLLYLLRKEWPLFPRLFFLLIANLHLGLILAFYGWNPGAWMYFFIMMTVPFAILSRRQKRWITPATTLAFVMLVATFAAFKIFDLAPLVTRPDRSFTLSILVNLMLVSLGSILLLRHMRNVHFQAEDGLEAEHRRSEELLLNVLPAPIARRLKQGEQPIADHLDEVTILFADIVGFTELAERSAPRDLVDRLNEIFTAFDELADRHGLEKIKTIGDCYMVVAGLPEPLPNHALAAARMAFDMQRRLEEERARGRHTLQIRIGLHSGPVIAGVIGRRKFSYDLWGDAVNTASRMESHGAPGEITVTPRTYELVRAEFTGVEREPMQIKGKGAMTTYFLRPR
jgi:class 3 adenylate cyclase